MKTFICTPLLHDIVWNFSHYTHNIIFHILLEVTIALTFYDITN